MDLQRISKVVESGRYTEGQLRWWVFNRANNGLDEFNAVHKVGRSVIIDVDALEKWIVSGRGAQAVSA